MKKYIVVLILAIVSCLTFVLLPSKNVNAAEEESLSSDSDGKTYPPMDLTGLYFNVDSSFEDFDNGFDILITEKSSSIPTIEYTFFSWVSFTYQDTYFEFTYTYKLFFIFNPKLNDSYLNNYSIDNEYIMGDFIYDYQNRYAYTGPDYYLSSFELDSGFNFVLETGLDEEQLLFTLFEIQFNNDLPPLCIDNTNFLDDELSYFEGSIYIDGNINFSDYFDGIPGNKYYYQSLQLNSLYEGIYNEYGSNPVFIEERFTLDEFKRFSYETKLIELECAYNTLRDIEINNSYNDGYQDGNSDGYQSGNSDGYQDGYSNGMNFGQNIGYQNGYSDALSKVERDILISKYGPLAHGSIKVESSSGDYFVFDFDENVDVLTTDTGYINFYYLIEYLCEKYALDRYSESFYITLVFGENYNSDLLSFESIGVSEISAFNSSDVAFSIDGLDNVSYRLTNLSDIFPSKVSLSSIRFYVPEIERVYSNTLKMIFETPFYDIGYEDGYSTGYKDGENICSKTHDDLKNDSYNLGYDAGFSEGYTENNFSLNNLFWTIAGLPFESFKGIWNTTFLGVNIAEFITGILMFGVCLYLVKKVIL